MNVVIFGATGFSGRVILQEVLKQKHEVTVLVRKKSRLPLVRDNLTVVEGDAMDRDIVRHVLTGKDAVMQCLGVGGKGDGKPNTFVSQATQIIVEEMESLHMQRLIVMSNVGAGNSRAFQPRFFNKIILPYFMKWLKVIIDDKDRMEPIVMNSKTLWTIVRCPNIVDKPAIGIIRPTLDGKGLKLSVTVHDLANFMVKQLTDQTYVLQAPSVSN